MENVLAARKILNQVRKKHSKKIRQIELDEINKFFNMMLIKNAKKTEITAFNTLVKTAQRSIDQNDKDFDYHLEQLNLQVAIQLYRHNSFVLETFEYYCSTPHLFVDKHQFQILVNQGRACIQSKDFKALRSITFKLGNIKIHSLNEQEMANSVNILKG